MASTRTIRRSLLLVEDDPIHLEIIQFHLQSQAGRIGTVDTCTRFEEALERVRNSTPDLVLLDLTLPDSDLDETLDRIPEIVASGAAVVAMSSLGTPEIAETARAHGAIAFLAKSDLASHGLDVVLDSLEEAKEADGAESGPILATRGPTDTTLATLASRLAHAASSWLTNQSFRLSTLEAICEASENKGPEEHVASLRKSTTALTVLAEAAREIINDEATSASVEPIELQEWLGTFASVRRPAEGPHGIDLEPLADPLTVAANPTGLVVIFDALVANAAALRSGESEPSRHRVRLEIQADATRRGRPTLDVVDDDGAWGMDAADRLTEPVVTGDDPATRAGIGMLRARRWMERMGGTLEIVERPAAPGEFLVRLTFAGA